MTSEYFRLRSFIAKRLQGDRNVALSAGHGFGHLPLGALDVEGQPDWTRLDLRENVRPTYDARFAQTFSPSRILATIERQVSILEHGNFTVLRELANTWSTHPDFEATWLVEPRNARQLGDKLDELAQVPHEPAAPTLDVSTLRAFLNGWVAGARQPVSREQETTDAQWLAGELNKAYDDFDARLAASEALMSGHLTLSDAAAVATSLKEWVEAQRRYVGPSVSYDDWAASELAEGLGDRIPTLLKHLHEVLDAHEAATSSR